MYNSEAGTVTIRPLAGEEEKPVVLEAQEFIAHLITHIPDVQERQVIYYGAYANASALQREHRRARQGQGEASPWAPPAEEPTPFERRCRMRWAQLIQRVWLEDPLLCPNCGGGMYIISFISFTESSYPAEGSRKSRETTMTAKSSYLSLSVSWDSSNRLIYTGLIGSVMSNTTIPSKDPTNSLSSAIVKPHAVRVFSSVLMT